MMNKLINKHFEEHKSALNKTCQLEGSIDNIANLLIDCLRKNGTIFWCGNGGSASDSQHLAGELVGRFDGNRKPLKSVALNADSAVMTCIINDFGYEQVFARQIEALGSKGDILVGISTSGNSKNIIEAFKQANQKDIVTVGLLGKKGGNAFNIAKHSVIVPSDSTARIQEMHILIGHILCDLIEEELNLKKIE
jgi:D-sedoheptulose 7-phosphate isomerase